MLEVTPLLLSWTCRLNGDGNTFDAICTVIHKDAKTVEVVGGLSKIPNGMTELNRLSKIHFKQLGYLFYEYSHKGKLIRRAL